MKRNIPLIHSGWGEIAGIQSPKVIRQFEGINKLDPFSIKDTHMVSNKNISTKKYPTATVREGYTDLSVTSGSTEGIMIWKEQELHAVSGGAWRKWDGAAWSTLLDGLDDTKKISFSNFKGNFEDVNLVVANGVNPVKIYDGTDVKDLENAPEGMNYVVGHENRLYGAVKNELHYSALRKPTDWTTVDQSGQLVIENNAGENITSVVAGTGKVVVFMPHSTHELYGTGPLNYRLQLISDAVGCVSHHSAVVVGGIMFFLSHDGLYRYGGGAAPKKDFSLPVQYIIDRVNSSAWDKVVAGTDGGRYYISLPIDDSTVPNITMEYDPQFGTWNIWDLGFTPSAYGIIDEVLYVGAIENKVVKMGGDKDNDSLVPYHLETKPFSFGSLAADNRLYRLWVVADVPNGAILNVHISNDKDGDGDSWNLVKQIVADETLTATQIIIPVNESFYHKWVRVKIEGIGPVTIHELTRQERTFRMGIGGG